jgi:hypothetical protein
MTASRIALDYPAGSAAGGFGQPGALGGRTRGNLLCVRRNRVARTKKRDANGTGANLGFEEQLWKAADALRANMDAGEYKHVVLGLIFLKYVSDAFEEQHARLLAEKKSGADPGTSTSTGPSTSSGCRRRPAGPS